MSCPVCFGGDDILVRESLNSGIGVLMGVTALVLAGFVRFFVGLARRQATWGRESFFEDTLGPTSAHESVLEK